MTLLKIYEDYKELSKQYVSWLEELVEKDFAGYAAEEILLKLENTRNQFEAMMEQSGGLEIETEQEANYKDLRYLVADALFLATDLAHFYKYEELGRFKMRVLNYLNKKRRVDVFGGQTDRGHCPIM